MVQVGVRMNEFAVIFIVAMLTAVTGWLLRNCTSTLSTSLRRRRTIGQSECPSHIIELSMADVSAVVFMSLSAFARIENHYFINDGFMRDGQLLEKQEIDKMCVTSIVESPTHCTLMIGFHFFQSPHTHNRRPRPLRCNLSGKSDHFLLHRLIPIDRVHCHRLLLPGSSRR